MPTITPNLLLIDADVAADKRAATITADIPSQLMLARDCGTAIKALSEHLIDLIILDRNAVAGDQLLDSVVATFHQIKGRHDVPVLITCGVQRKGVLLKTHPWGVAYHVPRGIAPMVMMGLIHGSLALKVGYESKQCRKAMKPCLIPTAVPKPRGLRIPEVIMPPGVHQPLGQNSRRS
jgi:response regulator RpfG family c-di-GMP phosphodiesterase